MFVKEFRPGDNVYLCDCPGEEVRIDVKDFIQFYKINSRKSFKHFLENIRGVFFFR